ncbi:DUF4291 domain-containing protein [Chitinophaga lutea]|uniref:DUF4291 domain-containing protein n=1 Tax=Chitinophaga lutea TaxID=2488634 RepID=A0A3N4PGF4_9BACT|nr:DUF4291 domain-containing protein [Chitinophaga lutea]RPE05609.1 DUF4291 domain-containing protein [Chitinophaga lutea]
MKERVIRALYNSNTVTVYQAFNSDIARTAVKNQTFVSPPFKKERMTWIKPSFLWMMYRAGWATKENQEHILSIRIKREGFEWALKNATLAHFDDTVHSSQDGWKETVQTSPVRIQWDPEKDIRSQPLPYRSIQIGLSGIAVEKYIADWIVGVEDITAYCKHVHRLVQSDKTDEAGAMLPVEKPYPLPDGIASNINAS